MTVQRHRRTFIHRGRFANYVVQVLSLLFSWGRPRGQTTTNPAKDMPKLRRPRGEADANRPWAVEEFSIAMAALPAELRPAVALGAYAGLREGDACALPWRAYAGCDTRDIMAITGHKTEAMATRYTRSADQKRRARSAINKLEEATALRNEQGTPDCKTKPGKV